MGHPSGTAQLGKERRRSDWRVMTYEDRVAHLFGGWPTYLGKAEKVGHPSGPRYLGNNSLYYSNI